MQLVRRTGLTHSGVDIIHRLYNLEKKKKSYCLCYSNLCILFAPGPVIGLMAPLPDGMQDPLYPTGTATDSSHADVATPVVVACGIDASHDPAA